MKDNSAHVGNKNFRTFILLTVVGLIAISCSPAQTPTTTATPQPSATTTLTPAPSPTPTATPFPGLSTDGPYLVFERYIGDQLEFFFYDSDGKGKKTVPIPLPEGATTTIDWLSPDGDWLAFYTGSAGVCAHDDEDFTENREMTEFDITLNLMNLSDGSIEVTIPLLQTDFLASIQDAARILSEQGISLDEGGGLGGREPVEILHAAFACGIHALAWSKDSRYLAFAGQMEGIFSDVYVYDRIERTVQRVTDGIEQIQLVEWSPDGNWIVYGTDNNTIGYNYRPELHAFSINDSFAMGIPGNFILDWLTSSTFLTSHYLGGLYKIDLRAQSVADIWSRELSQYAFDPENDMLAIIASEIDWQIAPSPTSLFLINLESGGTKKALQDIDNVLFIGNDHNRFLAFESITIITKDEYGTSVHWDDTGVTYFVDTDGSNIGTDFPLLERYFGNVSPDKRYISFDNITSSSGYVLRVFTVDGILVSEIPTDHSGYEIWMPDSSGLFVVQYSGDSSHHAKDIYTLDLSNGDFHYIDTIHSDEVIKHLWVAKD